MQTTLVTGMVVAVGAVALAAASQKTVRFSAGGLHYRAEGRGPVVVLIHAFQMDLREWDDVAAGLTPERRVVRYDVRGHGQSKVTNPLPATPVDLAGLLDELKIARATLVGSSMGSTIALDFAVTHPERVDRLVLIAPGIPGINVKMDFSWMQPIIEAVKSGTPQRASQLWWDSPLMAGVRQRGKDAARYRQIVLENSRVWTLPARPPALEPPAGTRLRALPMPILAVAGDLDLPGSVETARIVASSAPSGRSLIIPAAGHMLTLERSADITRLILDTDNTDKTERPHEVRPPELSAALRSPEARAARGPRGSSPGS
jgi:2-succinyl-6-hydroxy-2,4-cyclohexadiene-1-carboxylate synthase